MSLKCELHLPAFGVITLVVAEDKLMAQANQWSLMRQVSTMAELMLHPGLLDSLESFLSDRRLHVTQARKKTLPSQDGHRAAGNGFPLCLDCVSGVCSPRPPHIPGGVKNDFNWTF